MTNQVKVITVKGKRNFFDGFVVIVFISSGTGLWVVALATPYWLVFTPAKPGRLLWAHSGIWQKCDLVDGEPTPSGLRWHCWDTLR